MTGPLGDQWYRRDFPVLIHITRRFDDGATHLSAYELPAALDMPEPELQAALKALARRGFIDVVQSRSMGGSQPVVAVKDVSGQAYVMTGLHPGDDDVQGLVDAFRQAAEDTDDPAEKSRLQQIGDTLKDVSGDVAKRVLAAYIASQIPN